MPPSEGRKAVSQNNWDGSQWRNIESQGRADYAVEVKIPVSKLKEHSTNRDVITHTGNVHLKNYQWRVMKK